MKVKIGNAPTFLWATWTANEQWKKWISCQSSMTFDILHFVVLNFPSFASLGIWHALVLLRKVN